MLARVPVRHLAIHFGTAFAVVLAACAIPLVATGLLGARWPILLLLPAGGVVGFVGGVVHKVIGWMGAPVPFRIPLTAGQQRSLPQVKQSRLGNPHCALEAVVRVFVDVLLFRPLWRATPTAPAIGRGLATSSRPLWLMAAAFHGSLLVVLLRHLRLLLWPVPRFVALFERFDAVSDTDLPRWHLTSVLLLLGLSCLLGRRLMLPRLRYISLAADYVPLLLLIAIAATGIVIRHGTGTDVEAVKQLLAGVSAGRPVWSERMDPVVVTHLFLVGALLVYFPFSKLMHAAAAFMSPTLTLANDNRAVRHINESNPEVELRHYAQYEQEFRDRMVEAGLPVEKE